MSEELELDDPLQDVDGDDIQPRSSINQTKMRRPYRMHHSQESLNQEPAQIEQQHEDETTYLVKESEAAYIENHFVRGLYLLMEDPASSRVAFSFTVMLAVLIATNALLMCVETLPIVTQEHILTFKQYMLVELAFMLIFAVELVARTVAHSYSLKSIAKFLVHPLTVVDLVAIVPFFVELVVYGSAVYESQRFSILRLFRLFRLFRAYKYQSLLQLSIEVMIISVAKSFEALMAIFSFIAVLCISLGTLMHFAERHGNPQEFGTIPQSMWFTLATLTTTGYGDVVPQSVAGKLVACATMALGILTITLPSITISHHYVQIWDRMRQYRTPAGIGGRPQSRLTRESDIPMHELRKKSSGQLAPGGGGDVQEMRKELQQMTRALNQLAESRLQ